MPRIELFSRRKALGWDCWGNEVESDIELTILERDNQLAHSAQVEAEFGNMMTEQ